MGRAIPSSLVACVVGRSGRVLVRTEWANQMPAAVRDPLYFGVVDFGVMVDFKDAMMR